MEYTSRKNYEILTIELEMPIHLDNRFRINYNEKDLKRMILRIQCSFDWLWKEHDGRRDVMSLLFNHLKTYDTKTRENNQKIQNTYAGNATNHLTRVSSGREFTEGEILKGEVIDLRSNGATIQLSDGNVIQGKIDQEIDLYIGQMTTFEVGKVTDDGIQLKMIPEQEMNSRDNLIGKALIQAGLPLSSKNKEVVAALLDANLSVDKQSIQTFLKVVYQYPDAKLRDLLFLQKHNLPVDENHLIMLQEYHNSEHRIVSQIQSFVSSLGELLSDGANPELALKFLQLVLELPEYGDGQALHNESQQGVGEFMNEAGSQPAAGEFMNGAGSQQGIGEFMNGVGSHQGAENTLDSVGNQNGINSNVQFDISNQLQHLMTEQQLQRLILELERAGMSPSIVNEVREGNITGHGLLKSVTELLESSLTEEKQSSGLKGLLKSEEFQLLYKEELFHKYTLTPKQLENGENVKKYYEKLELDLDQLSQFLQKRNGNEEVSKITSQTEHLKNNLDFMKTLNQIYPYIQLPVRLKDQNIHSELYVFTKRKGSMMNAQNVSVLLHLDMEHLGGLDIHLQLSKSNLNAKFYVENEDIKELFEDTISELRDALAEKGYQVSSEFYVQEIRSDGLEVLELQDQAFKGMAMKRYTFDIRA